MVPQPELVQAFIAAGGDGKPRFGQLHVCWAESAAQARRTAYQWWPNAAIRGIASELRLPRDFEEVALLLSEEDVAGAVVCGPDPEPYLSAIRKYAEAGFDNVYLHQIGPDQDGFFGFVERELMPRLQAVGAGAR